MSTEPEDRWEKARRFARVSEPGPDHWPKGVRPISLKGLDLLGLDERHRLYWDGEEIVVTRKLELTPWQRRLGVAVAVAAILASIAQFAPWLGFEKAAVLWVSLKSLAQWGAPMPQIIGSIGLVLDMAGVVLLFIYGLPNPKASRTGVYEDVSPEVRAEYDRNGRLGLWLLIAGFAFQLAGNLMQLSTW